MPASRWAAFKRRQNLFFSDETFGEIRRAQSFSFLSVESFDQLNVLFFLNKRGFSKV